MCSEFGMLITDVEQERVNTKLQKDLVTIKSLTKS